MGDLSNASKSTSMNIKPHSDNKLVPTTSDCCDTECPQGTVQSENNISDLVLNSVKFLNAVVKKAFLVSEHDH